MYNNTYFIPRYNPTIINPNLIRNATTAPLARNIATNKIANTLASTTRNTGLLSKLNTGFSGIKSINWGGLINNTSKTLGIINQSIPLVKQVGPMVNNMKSMVRLASLFKDETDPISPKNIPPTTNITNNPPKTNPTKKEITSKTNEETNHDAPTFFIET